MWRGAHYSGLGLIISDAGESIAYGTEYRCPSVNPVNRSLMFSFADDPAWLDCNGSLLAPFHTS